MLGSDPWVYGLGDINRKALETLMQYSQEQGLIGRKMALDELFINTGPLLVMETAIVASVGPGTGAATCALSP